MGYCAGYATPGYATPGYATPGYGAAGWGRQGGGGRGGRGGGWGGRGRRAGWAGGWVPGQAMGAPVYAQPPAASEVEMLRQQARAIEQTLESLNRRIQEIEASGKEGKK